MTQFESEAEAEAWARFAAVSLSEMLRREYQATTGGVMEVVAHWADVLLAEYRARRVDLEAPAPIPPPTAVPPGAHNHSRLDLCPGYLQCPGASFPPVPSGGTER